MHDNDLVLIVDDDPQIRKMIALWLRGAGIAYEPAACEEEALERFTRGDVSCVLIDLKMGGDDRAGLDLLPKLRSMDPTVPLIIVTGFPDAAADHPDVDVIEKRPEGIDARDLVLKVKKALRDRCRDIKTNETHAAVTQGLQAVTKIQSMLTVHLEEHDKDRKRLSDCEAATVAALQAAKDSQDRRLGELLSHYAKDPLCWLLILAVCGMAGAKWVEINETVRAVRAIERKLP